jgi:hypothetical protein
MEACERGAAAATLRTRGMIRACERDENGDKQLEELYAGGLPLLVGEGKDLMTMRTAVEGGVMGGAW